jgi:hypothetical protein
MTPCSLQFSCCDRCSDIADALVGISVTATAIMTVLIDGRIPEPPSSLSNAWSDPARMTPTHHPSALVRFFGMLAALITSLRKRRAALKKKQA